MHAQFYYLGILLTSRYMQILDQLAHRRDLVSQRLRRTSYLIKLELLKHLLLLLTILLSVHDTDILLAERWMLVMLRIHPLLPLLSSLLVHWLWLRVANATSRLLRHEARRISQI